MKKLSLIIILIFSSVLAFAQHFIDINWTPGSQPAGVTVTKYNIYKSNISNTFTTPLAFINAPLTTYSDSAVTNGVPYYYTITSVCPTCDITESIFSSQVGPLFISPPNFTNVTATLTDGNGQIWANGTWSAELVPSFGNPGVPLNNGNPITDSPQRGTIDGTGTFTVVLDDNTKIFPSGSTWKFTLCPNASVTNCSQSIQVVFGASQNLSASISADLKPITVFALPVLNRAYVDTQVNADTGALYWRVTDNVIRGRNTNGTWSTIGFLADIFNQNNTWNGTQTFTNNILSSGSNTWSGNNTYLRSPGNLSNQIIFDSTQAGLTEQMQWKDNGNIKWTFGKDASNDFVLNDQDGVSNRLFFQAGGGSTSLASPTASPVIIQAGTNVQLNPGSGSVQINGPSTISGQFTSSLATGTPPFSIASTTLVPNLNVQNLNGVSVSGTPSVNQGVIATSPTAATWQTVSVNTGHLIELSLNGLSLPSANIVSSITLPGAYTIKYYLTQTGTCATGSTSVTVTLTWNDGLTRSFTSPSLTLGSTNPASAFLTGSVSAFLNSGAVTEQADVTGTCSTGGPATYKLVGLVDFSTTL